MGASRPKPSKDDAPEDITDALVALKGGAPGAGDRLANLVYDALRAIAHRLLQSERPGHTLSTTGLVHETYLKLVDQRRAEWSDRAQFFAVAARAMRRILVDYARKHRALRRGGHFEVLSIDEPDAMGVAAAERAEELIALDDALERLEALDPRLSRVVECRFFGGLTEAETAEVLGVTPRTVSRDWVKAKGWLYMALRDDGG